MISLSTRGLIATLAIGVTDPSASIRTGTTFLVAVTTSTGTARGAVWRGAWAIAPPGNKPLRVAAMAEAAATATTTANITTVRVFITALPRRAGLGSARPDSLCVYR
jgi:hypothetical protein